MSTLNRHTSLARRGRVKASNPARKAKRLAQNYGSKRRVEWIHTFACTCKNLHPACRGRVQASHTVSKAHRGNASNIIPQTAGCHAYIGTKGWAQWCEEVGELLDLGHPLDRHAVAASFAVRGPDAPGVSS